MLEREKPNGRELVQATNGWLMVWTQQLSFATTVSWQIESMSMSMIFLFKLLLAVGVGLAMMALL